MTVISTEELKKISNSIPAHLEQDLQVKPTAKSFARVWNWIKSQGTNANFWQGISGDEIEKILKWTERSIVHVLGFPLMVLAAALPAGWVASLVWGLESNLLFKLFWATAVFVPVFVVVFLALLVPMQPVWNKFFGCEAANKIANCLLPVLDEEMKPLFQEVSNNAWAMQFLYDVKASRPLTYQDFRVARYIAAQPR